MPAKDLLNINPDVLFEEHTISEIDDTQKKLLHEIERKREELRVMVGYVQYLLIFYIIPHCMHRHSSKIIIYHRVEQFTSANTFCLNYSERYRDLIEAADTIGDMKSTAQNCIKHIENMTLTCRNLHDTHLIGFKNEFIPANIEK